MGRQSGFIALDASMASGVVDICLIPEVPFKLDGPKGVFSYIEKVLAAKGHVVMCVAEGAGQDILATGDQKSDASGNPILKDAGLWLRSEVKRHFKDVDVKYIDPSMYCCCNCYFLSLSVLAMLIDRNKLGLQVTSFAPSQLQLEIEYTARFSRIMPCMLRSQDSLEQL